MTALQGRIETGTVANVLQYLALSRADGCLALLHPEPLQGHVYFDAGRVVFIEAKPFHDVAALAALLAWDSGRFVFRPGVSAPRRTLDQEVELLLVQASRHIDSSAALDGAFLGEDAVLAAAKGRRGLPSATDDQLFAAAPVADEVMLSLEALNLWRRLDGVNSLRQLATTGGRPVPELVGAAHELMEHGLAEFVSLVVADPRFAQELSREAIDLLGPVGAVVVEDAFFDLGLAPDALPVGAVDELIAELGRAFPASGRDEFLRRVAELRGLFALDAVAGR